MTDIGQFSKLTNLWPSPPTHRVEHSGQGGQTGQQKKRNPAKQTQPEHNEQDESSGLHIDEYV